MNKQQARKMGILFEDDLKERLSYLINNKKVHIGRVRTGLFRIAQQLTVPITPLTIDYTDHTFGFIHSQNFQIRVSKSFYVSNPVLDSVKVRNIFKHNLSRFIKEKYTK